MNIYRGHFDCAENAAAGRGVGLGNFDGIHAGHARLIEKLIAECGRQKLRAMVYTFENHPNNVIFKEMHTPLIITEEQKIQILQDKGVDELYLEHFDEEYAHTEPEQFVREIIVGKLQAKLVVVGYDYTYGDRGCGTALQLAAYGEKYGFDVFIIPPVTSFLPHSGENTTVSSTILRNLIKDGKMYDFKVLTGRYYSIPGRVVQGRNVGQTLGFPTANILPREGFAFPCFGVYATLTKTGGKSYKSITNIGNNPTFKNITTVTIETHIIGFKGELYGHDIEVEFIKKMRGEVQFSSVEELTRQLNADVNERKDMSDIVDKIYAKDGIEIYHVPADKFKTSVLRVAVCDTLSKDRAYKNALIPAILNSGSAKYPTMKKISEKLQEMYGANLSVSVSTLGEIQYTEFVLEFTDQKYVTDYDNLENDALQFVFDILTDPVTEDYNGTKGFSGSIFERERANRDDQIRSLINDKHAYAQMRCAEIMCKGEPYAVYHLGAAGDADGLTPTGLYQYYCEHFIREMPVKIFYSGRALPKKLTEIAVKCLGGTDRKPLQSGFLEKKEIPAADVKYEQEKLDVTQGKLFIGYRTNTSPESPDYYATALCNAILGQGTQSKLFANVREKNSLAYYAATYMNKFKGVLFAFCAIDPANREKAQQVMIQQVEDMKQGNISKDEFEAAVKMFRNDLLSYGDSQTQLLSYYFSQSFMSGITDPDEYIEKINTITIDDVTAAANRLTLDTIYFLTGEADAE